MPGSRAIPAISASSRAAWTGARRRAASSPVISDVAISPPGTAFALLIPSGTGGPPVRRAPRPHPSQDRMRITVFTYLKREDDKARARVVDQVARALKGQGPPVSILGVHGDVGKLRTGLTRRQPQ